LLAPSWLKISALKDIPGEARKLVLSGLASAKKASKKPQHLRWAEIKEEKLNDKISRKLAVGQNQMIARFRLAKGAVVPEH
jgi:hypothetical protein